MQNEWRALKTKQKKLKLQDKGNKPKRVCPPADEEINILYNRNVLGSHTPQSLLNTLMSYISRAKTQKSSSGIYIDGA
jgi:hypothetical protein